MYVIFAKGCLKLYTNSQHFIPQDLSQDEAAARLKQCEQTAVTSALSAACHGRPQCVVTADPAALQAPACAEQHVALKIAYACMDKVKGRPVSNI